MRRVVLLFALMLPLAGCGWLGHKSDDQTATGDAGAAVSSDAVLKKDCADENWKNQNLGLWYSVCRQPMKW